MKTTIESSSNTNTFGIYIVKNDDDLKRAPEDNSETRVCLGKGERVYAVEVAEHQVYLKVKVHRKLLHGFAIAEYLEKEE